MPEGPEIRRAADVLENAIAGKIILEVTFGQPHLRRHENRLTGHRVIAIETRGKAMLTHFDNGLAIYSHNQLYGRWYTVPAGTLPDTKRSLRLTVRTNDMSALLYSASDIAVLGKDGVENHPFLSRLGPDLLAPTTGINTILNRLQDKPFRRRRLGNLLTDQSFVAGIGNYLRCEILFASGLHPRLRPIDLSSDQQLLLVNLMHKLPLQSYRTGGITNDISRAKKLIKRGSNFEEARFYLFRREEKPCYHCASTIEKHNAGGQACYICPKCQAIP